MKTLLVEQLVINALTAKQAIQILSNTINEAKSSYTRHN